MKYPRGYAKFTEIEKRKWVHEELKKKHAELDELKKLSRELTSIKNFIPKVDERPDLEKER